MCGLKSMGLRKGKPYAELAKNVLITISVVALLTLHSLGSTVDANLFGKPVAPAIAPDQLIELFIESYSIPTFVLESIDPSVSDVIRDGIKLAYIIAIEGIVLLKNEGNALPLRQSERVAVFGVGQHWTWRYHLGGSAYVSVPQKRCVTLLEGLLNAGFSIDEELVRFYEEWVGMRGRREQLWWGSVLVVDEPQWSEEQIGYYSRRNEVAIVVISRLAMEDRDLHRGPGGYELTEQEKRLIQLTSRYFNKTIVILNTPGPIDMSWDNQDVDAILWVGYPGEQGGHAVAAILLGLASPSGKLPTTWARKLDDYPSTAYFGHTDAIYWEDIYVGYRYFDTFGVDVAYPFGYGLSYSRFRIDVVNVAVVEGHYVRVDVNVTNVGAYSGKEVVQVYVSKPEELNEKPYQELVAFAKTDTLPPNHSQTLSIVFDVRNLASYSEELSAWVLDRGAYKIRVGNSSRNTSIAAILTIDRTVIVEDTINRLGSPQIPRLSKRSLSPRRTQVEDVPLNGIAVVSVDPSAIPTLNKSSTPQAVPEEFKRVDLSKTITLADVLAGRYSLGQLVAQMSLEELVNITIGLRGMPKYGVPELRHADGPNGVRSGPSPNPGGVAYPAATILAASWNSELAKVYGYQIGRELLWANISLWLAPGLNIHRNPLGGRNAEYFSEDPVLSGVMAAAVTKGVQNNHGVGVTLKHFVCNEQEYNRMRSNSVVSERALREIYLRPFEIAVKTADPWAVMTSYNKVNGVYTGNNFNLIEGVLRYEWGFNGFVMTDWFSASYNYKAYYAGNDALMPYHPLRSREVLNQVMVALTRGEITLGHLHRSAYNVLKVVMRSRAFAKLVGVDQSRVYLYAEPQDYFIVMRAGPTPLNHKPPAPVITTVTVEGSEAWWRCATVLTALLLVFGALLGYLVLRCRR